MSTENAESLIAQLRADLASEREARQKAETTLENRERTVSTAQETLRKALARAEQAERETQAAMDGWNEVQGLLEQAERERDEWKASHEKALRLADTMRNERDAEMAARERAEADNAALLAEITTACREDPYSAASLGLVHLLTTHHPGAALLEESNERRDLLEAVAKACRGLGPVTPEVESVVGRALDELRALREVADSLRSLAPHDEACQLEVNGASDPTNCAACAYDALKGGGT